MSQPNCNQCTRPTCQGCPNLPATQAVRELIGLVQGDGMRWRLAEWAKKWIHTVVAQASIQHEAWLFPEHQETMRKWATEDMHSQMLSLLRPKIRTSEMGYSGTVETIRGSITIIGRRDDPIA